MKKLSKELYNLVLNTYKPGLSIREISKATTVTKSLVAKILKENNKPTLKIKKGRKKILSIKKETCIVRKFKNKEFIFATDAKKFVESEFNIKISDETIRSTIKTHGICCFKKKIKPALTNIHMKKRLNFAKITSAWNFFDWKKIIFSDESKFNLHGSDGATKVWCLKEERLNQTNIQSVKKFGGGNVMIWGCITAFGVGKLIRVPHTINSKGYCQVLYDGLIPTYEKYSLLPSSYTFMHDNATCHVSRETREWLRINNLVTLDWPANSPDLNPIEHVWAYLDKKLRARNQSFTDADQLWKILEDEWYKIPKNYIERLFFSMCARVKAVIKSKGDNTKY